MPPPGPGSVETIEYEAAQRLGSTGTQPDRVEAPDRGALSQGAEDLLRLQEDTIAKMGDVYQRPEEAYRRLTELDEAGVARFREDPSEIGPLRQGVQPTQKTVEALVIARDSYGLSSPEDRQDVQVYTEQDMATKVQAPAQSSGEDKSLSEQMNQSLTMMPTSVHYMSI